MEKERSYEGGFSVIEVTAVLAVLILAGTTLWQSNTNINNQAKSLAYEVQPSADSTGSAPNSDPYTEALNQVTAPTSSSGVGSAVIQQLLNAYEVSKNQGTYTPEYAAAIGSSVAPMLNANLAYEKFSENNILTNSDTSEKASLAYQNALHDALAPLRTNTTPEFEFFGMYLQTKDPQYLIQLLNVAALYKEAASNAALVVVPTDVVQYHIGILNALEEFSSVLTALNTHANDPIESTVLLRNYNNAEQDVLTSFNALRSYYANKYAHNHS